MMINLSLTTCPINYRTFSGRKFTTLSSFPRNSHQFGIFFPFLLGNLRRALGMLKYGALNRNRTFVFRIVFSPDH